MYNENAKSGYLRDESETRSFLPGTLLREMYSPTDAKRNPVELEKYPIEIDQSDMKIYPRSMELPQFEDMLEFHAEGEKYRSKN